MEKSFALAEVKSLDGNDPNGQFEVILSAPTLDRDGEVIDARAFDPLPDHVTFDIDHGLSVATTVGSGTPRYEGELLKVTGSFSSIPRAQEVRALVNEGHIRTTSVAFMSPKREVKDGIAHIVKAELLNGAFVPVPSNREAAVLVSKSIDSRSDAQGRHLKTVAGSYEQRQDELRQAILAANPNAWWITVLATFDDAIVYELDEGGQYRAPYTIEDGALTLGSAEPIEVSEVVAPKAADDSDDEKSTNTDPETSAAGANAPAAESPAEVVVARAKADLAEAEALLASS